MCHAFQSSIMHTENELRVQKYMPDKLETFLQTIVSIQESARPENTFCLLLHRAKS